MAVSPEQVVIGSGNESLYGILVTLLGRHNVYAVESPGYPLLDRLYRQQGVEQFLPSCHRGHGSRREMVSGGNVYHRGIACFQGIGTNSLLIQRQMPHLHPLLAVQAVK